MIPIPKNQQAAFMGAIVQRIHEHWKDFDKFNSMAFTAYSAMVYKFLNTRTTVIDLSIIQQDPDFICNPSKFLL